MDGPGIYYLMLAYSYTMYTLAKVGIRLLVWVS